MPVPHTTEAFGDLLDIRFQEIFDRQFPAAHDMLPELFNFEPNNGRIDMRFSEVSGYGDIPEFSGSVTYQSAAQGYDTTITPVEFASGIQVERRLFDTDQYSIMNQRPAGLARSAQRTRQKHGARPFNNAFSVDKQVLQQLGSRGALLGLAYHRGAERLDGKRLRQPRHHGVERDGPGRGAHPDARFPGRGGEPDRRRARRDSLSARPLRDRLEINSSMGKVDTAENNRNVHFGRYTMKEWNYLTDTNNWFLMDSSLRSDALKWFDSVPVEFAMAEDLDTLVAKWRLYMVYGNGHRDWRFISAPRVS